MSHSWPANVRFGETSMSLTKWKFICETVPQNWKGGNPLSLETVLSFCGCLAPRRKLTVCLSRDKHCNAGQNLHNIVVSINLEVSIILKAHHHGLLQIPGKNNVLSDTDQLIYSSLCYNDNPEHFLWKDNAVCFCFIHPCNKLPELFNDSACPSVFTWLLKAELTDR